MTSNLDLNSKVCKVYIINESDKSLRNIQLRTLSKDVVKIKKIKGNDEKEIILNKSFKEKTSPLWLDIVYSNNERDTYGIVANLSYKCSDSILIKIINILDNGQLIINIEENY